MDIAWHGTDMPLRAALDTSNALEVDPRGFGRYARDLATLCLERDPELTDPGLADIVDAVEYRAAGDWMDRT
jgi:hypothetical protein